MTQDLYRTEALRHRNRSLYGDIVLRSPPPLWGITLIILSLSAFVLWGLFGLNINGQALWHWLVSGGQT